MTNPVIETGSQVPQTCVLTTAPICPSSTGVEPAIFSSEGKRAIRYATRTTNQFLESNQKTFLIINKTFYHKLIDIYGFLGMSYVALPTELIRFLL